MKMLISHINEEALLACKLKEWIEGIFAGQADVFVSSDREDLPPGVNWLGELRIALDSAKVLILLCSEISILRPWVNFEAGCAWIKPIPIIPICHSGLTVGMLPPPLSSFQALNLKDPQFSRDLILGLGDHLLLKAMVPKLKINYAEMNRDLLDAAAHIKTPAQIQPNMENNSGGDVTPEQLNVLKILIDMSPHTISADQLARQLNIKLERMRYLLDVLHDKKLVYFILQMGGPALYGLSKEGRGCLVSKGLL